MSDTLTKEARSEEAVVADQSVIRQRLRRTVGVSWGDNTNGTLPSMEPGVEATWRVSLGFKEKQDRHTVTLEYVNRDAPEDRVWVIASSDRYRVVYDTVVLIKAITFAIALRDLKA